MRASVEPYPVPVSVIRAVVVGQADDQVSAVTAGVAEVLALRDEPVAFGSVDRAPIACPGLVIGIVDPQRSALTSQPFDESLGSLDAGPIRRLGRPGPAERRRRRGTIAQRRWSRRWPTVGMVRVLAMLEVKNASVGHRGAPATTLAVDVHEATTLQTTRRCPLADPVRAAEVIAAVDALQQKELPVSQRVPGPYNPTIPTSSPVSKWSRCVSTLARPSRQVHELWKGLIRTCSPRWQEWPWLARSPTGWRGHGGPRHRDGTAGSRSGAGSPR